MQIEIIDNSQEVLKDFQAALARALEECGLTAEKYAKQLAPVDTGALRNSISHTVDGDTATVGTAQSYAVYQELGTGKYATGGGGRPTPWAYKGTDGKWHRTSGNRPHPFIKPAVADHVEDYRKIVEAELKNTGG